MSGPFFFSFDRCRRRVRYIARVEDDAGTIGDARGEFDATCEWLTDDGRPLYRACAVRRSGSFGFGEDGRARFDE